MTLPNTGAGGCPWCGVWWLGDEVGEVQDERKPMLRVVRLPEGTVEPAPVSLDTGYALDDCLRRERVDRRSGAIARLPPTRETR